MNEFYGNVPADPPNVARNARFVSPEEPLEMAYAELVDMHGETVLEAS